MPLLKVKQNEERNPRAHGYMLRSSDLQMFLTPSGLVLRTAAQSSHSLLAPNSVRFPTKHQTNQDFPGESIPLLQRILHQSHKQPKIRKYVSPLLQQPPSRFPFLPPLISKPYNDNPHHRNHSDTWPSHLRNACPAPHCSHKPPCKNHSFA